MNNWQQVFYSSISVYIAIINKYLLGSFPMELLGKYFIIQGGYAFKSSEYVKSGIPVIRISDFQNEVICLDNVKYYKESQNFAKYELCEGDIIIAMTGATIGKLAIVQQGLGKLYLNQRVGRFSLKKQGAFFSEYIYWLARGVEGKIKKLAWGGAQPNISSKKIEAMEFPFPTLSIQRGISNFLSDLKNNRITNIEYFHKETEGKILTLHTNQLNSYSFKNELTHQQTLLKKLRQQILQEAIQGQLTADWRAEHPHVEPAAELLARIQAEKAQLIKDKKIKKQKPLPPIGEAEKPFELPEGWVWCRIWDIAKQITSGSRGWAKYYTDSGAIFLTMGNLSKESYQLRMNKVRYVKPPRNSEGSRTKLEEGDLLISITGDVGNLGVIPKGFGEAYINQHTCMLRFMPLCQNRYFLELMRSPLAKKQFNAPQRGIKNSFRLGDVGEMIIPLPPLSEQKAIITKVEKLLALCDQLETQITNNQTHAEQLMRAVLREAFTQTSEQDKKEAADM